MRGATEEAIAAAEQALGRTFPDDYRAFLRRENGLEGWFGDSYLILYRIEDVPDLHALHRDASHMPGFVAIGSDGGGELFGFDLRSRPYKVVMVGNVSSGWPGAVVQAASFDDFMDKRRRGEPFDFATS